MQKVVINKTYGGFGLSRKALHLLREWKHPLALKEVDIGEKWPGEDEVRKPFLDSFLKRIDRTDPLLIKAIEQLGEDANPRFGNLAIVELPDNVEWQIEEYDGWEHIAEKHRVWG